MKQASYLIKGGGYPTQQRLPYHTTAFEVFDEKEMFATVMEQKPGGELLDKVVEEYDRKTFMAEEFKDFKFICENWLTIGGQYFLA